KRCVKKPAPRPSSACSSTPRRRKRTPYSRCATTRQSSPRASPRCSLTAQRCGLRKSKARNTHHAHAQPAPHPDNPRLSGGARAFPERPGPALPAPSNLFAVRHPGLREVRFLQGDPADVATLLRLPPRFAAAIHRFSIALLSSKEASMRFLRSRVFFALALLFVASIAGGQTTDPRAE